MAVKNQVHFIDDDPAWVEDRIEMHKVTPEEYEVAMAFVRCGYSIHKTATELGKKGVTVRGILRRKKVKSFLKDVIRRAEKEHVLTAREVLQELSRRAMADPTIFFNDDGSIKNLSEIDPEYRHHIREIQVMLDREGTAHRTFKMTDKDRALEILAKHHKLLKDDDKGAPQGEFIINLNLGGNG